MPSPSLPAGLRVVSRKASCCIEGSAGSFSLAQGSVLCFLSVDLGGRRSFYRGLDEGCRLRLPRMAAVEDAVH